VVTGRIGDDAVDAEEWGGGVRTGGVRFGAYICGNKVIMIVDCTLHST
jgi:hypothetical protein